MDIKETSVIFDNGGTFSQKNQLFCNPVEIISTTGQYKSGKLIDVTVIAEGSDKFFDMDLLFFPDKSILNISPMEQFSMPFDKMKHCAGRIQLIESDFSNVGGCSIANLFNLNMTFQFKHLCMIAVYQGEKTITTKPNSIALTLGYELGSCS
jgi:hypothetical protein